MIKKEKLNKLLEKGKQILINPEMETKHNNFLGINCLLPYYIQSYFSK